MYSTFLGQADIASEEIVVDGLGRAFVTGTTRSPDFPTTAGAYDTTLNGTTDAYVTMLNIHGSALLFSTFLGGCGADGAGGIDQFAILIYVAGNTTPDASCPFPTTMNAYDSTPNGGMDAFLTRFPADGSSLQFSTLIGGAGQDSASDVDSEGDGFVTGVTFSSDFPTTAGAYSPSDAAGDTFLTRFNSTATGLVYSTYLGGGGGASLDLDNQLNAFVTGFVHGSTLAPTQDAYDASYNGGTSDGYVEELSADGSQPLYASYLGGSLADGAQDMALDGAGNAYVAGFTDSTNFPSTAGAADGSFNGQGDAFATKFHLKGGRVIVVKRAYGPEDFSFSVSGNGVSQGFQLDDDADPTLPNSKAFDVTVGNNFGISEAQPPGWLIAKASCDDGSPVANVDVQQGETVTCTFINLKPYPRPGGATPLRVPLVPAYRVCQQINANSQHVPPLDRPSCEPPRLASDVLTTSAVGKMGAHARLDVRPGDLGTTTDEADVATGASVSDVKNQSDGSDYDGPLILTTTILRITDRANSPEGVAAATTEDFEFALPFDCQPTLDPSVGSTCVATTTFDSMVPGSVIEGKRAVMRIAAAKIKDAGADENILPPPGGFGCPPTCGSGDERTFLEQGVFAP